MINYQLFSNKPTSKTRSSIRLIFYTLTVIASDFTIFIEQSSIFIEVKQNEELVSRKFGENLTIVFNKHVELKQKSRKPNKTKRSSQRCL